MRMLQIGSDVDLRQKPLRTKHRGQLGPQHLERDVAVVLEVAGEVNRGHAAGTQLTLDLVPIGDVGHESIQWRRRHKHVPVLGELREEVLAKITCGRVESNPLNLETASDAL